MKCFYSKQFNKISELFEIKNEKIKSDGSWNPFSTNTVTHLEVIKPTDYSVRILMRVSVFSLYKSIRLNSVIIKDQLKLYTKQKIQRPCGNEWIFIWKLCKAFQEWPSLDGTPVLLVLVKYANEMKKLFKIRVHAKS